ncbi:MAG: acyltransferase family protein [Verrucomicrobia bacterium]|nr:acyltransferase family protein [Verrucomicrobiota bacterium]
MASDPADARARYLPGLDGIRAIAVGAVVAYHLRVPFFDGGLLGVSVFFTLSGYLITSLLLESFEGKGRIDLKDFWIRRARRLLPALLLMLPVVVVTTAIARPAQVGRAARQALFALLYVANWTTIARGDDYFQRFAGPGPLDHLWSLAIEEQFYVLWPLLVAGLLVLGRRAGAGRRPLVAATVAFTTASTWAIWHLYHPLALNHTRAYEGTDARAAALLVGALAAMALPFDRVGAIAGRRRVVLDVVGVLGLAGVVLCIARTDEYSSFLYRGGELVLATSTAALSMAAAHPQGLLARALGVAPLRWIGARSYGVYLWHMPVVAFLPDTILTHRPVARGLVQLALILVLAAASFTLIEDPIRRRTWVARPRRARVGLAFRAIVLVPIATVALAAWSWLRRPSSDLEALAASPVPTATIAVSASVAIAPTIPVKKVAGAPWTSCGELAHVGDSTSLGLTMSAFLPDPADQITARYHAVGVEKFWPEISGARSMVETYGDQPSATDIVRYKRKHGYDGCFVLALGTNDPANVRGNAPLLSERIDAMMAEAAGVRVLWTTTKTLISKGPYQNAHMRAWNEVLIQACTRHSNMRVYDWASEVEDGWYTTDGIHFNGPGYKERAQRLARALARAFPKDAPPSAECLVHGGP